MLTCSFIICSYVPREESVSIRQILMSTRRQKDRFPVVCPEDLPRFNLDPNLIRFIHRNAISNSCKYGKLGGVVSTHVKYDACDQILSVNIINEPGTHHQRLVELAEKASKDVFLSGKRLHGMFAQSDSQDEREVSFSSGDGAWIMRKCARIMGGDVAIHFKQERTVFNLTIPVKPAMAAPTVLFSERFEVPSDTIGIVVDDSKVQRKLLERLLSLLGIRKENTYVFGETAEEVSSSSD